MTTQSDAKNPVASPRKGAKTGVGAHLKRQFEFVQTQYT